MNPLLLALPVWDVQVYGMYAGRLRCWGDRLYSEFTSQTSRHSNQSAGTYHADALRRHGNCPLSSSTLCVLSLWSTTIHSLTLWRPLLSYVPDQVKPSFVIFDIRALWRSTLPVSMGMTGEWLEELMSSMPCQSCVNLTVIGRCVFDELIDACTTHKQLFAANFYWLMRLWSR